MSSLAPLERLLPRKLSQTQCSGACTKRPKGHWEDDYEHLESQPPTPWQNDFTQIISFNREFEQNQ
jgi:hypothetical protein